MNGRIHKRNKQKKGKTKMNKKILGVALLVLLVLAMVLVYVKFSDKPVEGSKSVTIEVVNSEKESVKYELKTDALYLAEAMEEAEGLEYETEDGPYGLTVLSVNGERAVYDENGAYWGFYVNDEYCNYGISEQPVNDGDYFKIEYTK